MGNGNYVWISYFYSYLNETGRAGFVMSSQASSAGRREAAVRRKLVESGDVDVMIAIRPNFFYTRTVPCELWFLNRAKPEAHRDKVLMIDARNVYRKVTRKIYDFSPEQQQNLLAVVWLYRGERKRFLELVFRYLENAAGEGVACFQSEDPVPQRTGPLPVFLDAVALLRDALSPFLDTQPNGVRRPSPWRRSGTTTSSSDRTPSSFYCRSATHRRSATTPPSPAPRCAPWWTGSPRWWNPAATLPSRPISSTRPRPG